MGIPPPIETANISMGDTLLLMVIALVVLGPRRLPQIGRQIGKLMYEFRKASNDFKFQMEEELRQSEESDRRKKEEEERKRALAAAPPSAQIAPPEIAPMAESPITPPAPTGPDPQITPDPPAAIAADVPEAVDLNSGPSVGILASEPSAPRILPPSTGETIPAERPGAQPRQRELFAADRGTAAENNGEDAAGPEAERSEPATHHG